ncbi:MAG: hypothetical protein HYW86_01800 [Candidatus Roizmanbacteria bacterium]|nr:MAG: hypothetical protein HYW86_01800 [Candidatus Roizmanbacteria bacterium]
MKRRQSGALEAVLLAIIILLGAGAYSLGNVFGISISGGKSTTNNSVPSVPATATPVPQATTPRVTIPRFEIGFLNPLGWIVDPRYRAIGDQVVMIPSGYRKTAWGELSLRSLASRATDLNNDGFVDYEILYYPLDYKPDTNPNRIFEIVDGQTGKTIFQEIYPQAGALFIDANRLWELTYSQLTNGRYLCKRYTPYDFSFNAFDANAAEEYCKTSSLSN